MVNVGTWGWSVGIAWLEHWELGGWVEVSKRGQCKPTLFATVDAMPVLAVRNAGQVASISGGVQGGLRQYLVSMTK